jgi:hypothetical protein
MTAGRHPESMKNTNYHLSRLAAKSHGGVFQEGKEFRVFISIIAVEPLSPYLP